MSVDSLDTVLERRLPFILETAVDAGSIGKWLSTQDPTGKWPDVDYSAGFDAPRANWLALDHWVRINTMACAWSGPLEDATQYQGSPEVLKAMHKAIDYWFANDYTDLNCMDGSCAPGTPGLWNTNWWWNVIGIPTYIARDCLLLHTTLTPSQLTHATFMSQRAYDTFHRKLVGVGPYSGANTLDVASIGIDLGLLKRDGEVVRDAYGKIHKEMVVRPENKTDGIKPDGSFGQHRGLLYSGNYGNVFTKGVLRVEIMSARTEFQADDTEKAAFYTHIGGSVWMVYLNTVTGILHWDLSTLGRHIGTPVADQLAGVRMNQSIGLDMFRTLGDLWDSDVLRDAFNRWSRKSPDANVGPLMGNRMFWNGDYMVHRGNGYITTVKMYSTRTLNAEYVNKQNPFGFHLSDGTTYTYAHGDEYEDISAAWDWNLIPGTTVDYKGTPLEGPTMLHAGLEAFVGGASDGEVGIAVMRYTNPATRKLGWQKAWFFLQGDVQHVMVSGITQQKGTEPVYSVLDQKKHKGGVFVDGSLVTPGSFEGAKTLWHDDVGYVFAPEMKGVADLSIDYGNRTGDWSKVGASKLPPFTVDLFSAWLHHKDSSSSVGYTVFPAVSHSAFDKKAAGTQLVTLRNDAKVSALHYVNTSTTMIVFWDTAGGEVRDIPPSADSAHASIIGVSSDVTGVVILRQDKWTVTVSDPSQELKQMKLTLTLAPGNRREGWDDGLSRLFLIQLPSDALVGRSITVAL